MPGVPPEVILVIVLGGTLYLGGQQAVRGVKVVGRKVGCALRIRCPKPPAIPAAQQEQKVDTEVSHELPEEHLESN